MTNPPAARQERQSNEVKVLHEWQPDGDDFVRMVEEDYGEGKVYRVESRSTPTEAWEDFAWDYPAAYCEVGPEIARLAARVAELERERDEARRALWVAVERVKDDYNLSFNSFMSGQIALARAAARKEE